jgi:rubrerythrin
MNSESLNFNIGNFSDKYLSEREKFLRSKSKIKIFTIEEVQSFILSQDVNEEIKKDLLVLLNKYPHAAYNNFIENINKNIQVIMEKRNEYIRQTNPNYKDSFNEKNKNTIKKVSFEDIDEEAKKEAEIEKEEENSSKSILDELKEELN